MVAAWEASQTYIPSQHQHDERGRVIYFMNRSYFPNDSQLEESQFNHNHTVDSVADARFRQQVLNSSHLSSISQAVLKCRGILFSPFIETSLVLQLRSTLHDEFMHLNGQVCSKFHHFSRRGTEVHVKQPSSPGQMTQFITSELYIEQPTTDYQAHLPTQLYVVHTTEAIYVPLGLRTFTYQHAIARHS